MSQTTEAREFISERVQMVEGLLDHLGWHDREPLEILTDLLTDLRYYARAHGIQSSTFRELASLSEAHYRAELSEAGEF